MLSTDEGKSTDEISDETELSSSSISKHVTKLRGLGLIERHRDEDEGLLIYLTVKGEKLLNQTNLEGNSNPGEVSTLVVSVKISADDICEELEQLMEEEGLSSYSEAVDYALADYFDLLDDEEIEEQELKENR